MKTCNKLTYLSVLMRILGLPYMAHMHFRQVKLLQPSFPGIDDILKHLEDDEVKYAMRVNTIPLQVIITTVQSSLVLDVSICIQNRYCFL